MPSLDARTVANLLREYDRLLNARTGSGFDAALTSINTCRPGPPESFTPIGAGGPRSRCICCHREPSTKAIGVPFATLAATRSASQFVRRTQPWDSAFETLSGEGVP